MYHKFYDSLHGCTIIGLLYSVLYSYRLARPDSHRLFHALVPLPSLAPVHVDRGLWELEICLQSSLQRG